MTFHHGKRCRVDYRNYYAFVNCFSSANSCCRSSSPKCDLFIVAQLLLRFPRGQSSVAVKIYF
ncbi:hypothetical protein DRB05_19655 [Pseudoalteromonas sp. A757]|nr:hypothetical protein DRB05_19655 [Pseudoalteromonas sp. A757]